MISSMSSQVKMRRKEEAGEEAIVVEVKMAKDKMMIEIRSRTIEIGTIEITEIIETIETTRGTSRKISLRILGSNMTM